MTGSNIIETPKHRPKKSQGSKRIRASQPVKTTKKKKHTLRRKSDTKQRPFKSSTQINADMRTSDIKQFMKYGWKNGLNLSDAQNVLASVCHLRKKRWENESSFYEAEIRLFQTRELNFLQVIFLGLTYLVTLKDLNLADDYLSVKSKIAKTEKDRTVLLRQLADFMEKCNRHVHWYNRFTANLSSLKEGCGAFFYTPPKEGKWEKDPLDFLYNHLNTRERDKLSQHGEITFEEICNSNGKDRLGMFKEHLNFYKGLGFSPFLEFKKRT